MPPDGTTNGYSSRIPALHATLLLAAGMPVPSVCSRLVHANSTITISVYAHAIKRQDEEAAGAICELALEARMGDNWPIRSQARRGQLELLEAIKSRKSIRGYKADPVPKEIIAAILSTALRAPSSANSQPWEITVVAGEVLERLKRANMELLDSGVAPNLETKFGPFAGVYRQRQIDLAIQLFKLLGIAREEKDKAAEWRRKGYRFFDAPAAIIMSVDRSLDEAGCLFDVGALAQTIALTALHYGLGSCIQNQALMSPQAVRRTTEIPESKRLVICLTVGYPDWDFPANRIESEREKLENVVTWRGYDA